MVKTKLFCIPYAGGSKLSFRSFCEHPQTEIEIIPLELPGRASRIREPLSTDLDFLTTDLFRQIEPHINGPYAIYGHSMGALMAFLVTKHIAKLPINQPLHLIVTGCAAPSVKNIDLSKLLGHLSPSNFLQALLDLGGIPNQILSEKSLLDYFLEISRADIVASDSYVHHESEPLDIPLTAMVGKEELVTYEETADWQKETIELIEVLELPGNHFFPFDLKNKVIDYIVNLFQEHKKETIVDKTLKASIDS